MQERNLCSQGKVGGEGGGGGEKTLDSEAQTGNLLWQIMARYIQLLFLKIKIQSTP